MTSRTGRADRRAQVKRASGSRKASSQRVRVGLGNLRQASPSAFAMRFALGAVISLVAGLVGLRFGPRVGGVFLAFPAILPAALTLIEKADGEGAADADTQGGILGGIGLLAFTAVVVLLVRHLGAPIALVAALLTWVVVSTGLYFLLRLTWPHAWR